jgi:hypothetical protein
LWLKSFARETDMRTHVVSDAHLHPRRIQTVARRRGVTSDSNCRMSIRLRQTKLLLPR